MMVINDNTAKIIVAVILMLALLLIVMVVRSIRKCFHGTYTEIKQQPDFQYTEATVVSKGTYMEKHGTKTSSHHRIVYMAEFLTKQGKTVRCEVPQEIYQQLQQNQKGTLAILDGEFFDFQ